MRVRFPPPAPLHSIPTCAWEIIERHLREPKEKTARILDTLK